MFNFSQHLQDLKSSIIGLTLLLATAIIGLIWISIGIYSFTVILLGPVWGPVVLGLLFILPLIIYVLVKVFGAQERQLRARTAAESEYAQSSVLHMSRIIESLSGRSPLLAAVAAIIGGFLATRFPQLLSLFTQVVQAYADDARERAEKKAAAEGSDKS